MLQKPHLQDETIIAALRKGYALAVTDLEFMPIGNDSSAWVYRVSTKNEGSYFLKLKRGELYKPSVVVPHTLKNSGIEQVVAPLSTQTGHLWQRMDDFSLILCRFVEGHTGMQQGLSDSQWIELGNVLKRIHTAQLPDEILEQVGRETFVPHWLGTVRAIQKQIVDSEFSKPYEQELAAFWQSKDQEIGKIIERAEELGRLLQKRSLQFVLCHTDIHTANVLIDSHNHLYIVDWDQPLLAPKERDLMFVENSKASLFFSGYGEATVDTLVLAYYCYEWVVQEIGDYGERVFLRMDLVEETKHDAVQEFRQLFEPDDVVEAAYRANPT